MAVVEPRVFFRPFVSAVRDRALPLIDEVLERVLVRLGWCLGTARALESVPAMEREGAPPRSCDTVGEPDPEFSDGILEGNCTNSAVTTLLLLSVLARNTSEDAMDLSEPRVLDLPAALGLPAVLDVPPPPSEAIADAPSLASGDDMAPRGARTDSPHLDIEGPLGGACRGEPTQSFPRALQAEGRGARRRGKTT